jgi:hypothetical protein
MNANFEEVKLTGTVRTGLNLPGDFYLLNVGDIVISNGWPHIVIDAGVDQGKRIAAFRSPYSWRVVK